MGVSVTTPSDVVNWLLEGPGWVSYRARADLLGESKEKLLPEWKRVAADRELQALVQQTSEWPWPKLSSHKSASHPIHKLAFLADLGFDTREKKLAQLATSILDRGSEEGALRVIVNVSKSYGGSGQDTWAWALCDAPLTAYSLIRMGMGEEERVRAAVEHLVSLVRDNGWPCAVSKEMGRFRGPGGKNDPCPYANLVMLKLLAQLPRYRTGSEARIGVEILLSLWDKSQERHPYMFYMGTDFRKLKAPFIWYDIMHVAEVLSQFPYALKDERMKDMISVIRRKGDARGQFTPESVWTDWRNWEFGQKKVPSRWLTLCAHRVLARCLD